MGMQRVAMALGTRRVSEERTTLFALRRRCAIGVNSSSLTLRVGIAVTLCCIALRTASAAEYAVVVSAATNAEEGWKDVSPALVKKNGGEVIVYDKSVDEALPKLKALHPRQTCFVARPAEATKKFVAAVHQLTRKLDDDPYTDTQWGILTGFDAANALTIARDDAPLTVKKVAGGTELALDKCTEGLWYDELVKNKVVRKTPGATAAQEQGPNDTTKSLVDTLNEYKPDLFVTSGHATERDWMIGFRYKNGFFKSQAGRMFGEDTRGEKFDVDSPSPKVYLAVGNCLMGHINGQDAMALAWLNKAGVRQMAGYTDLTWFGYGGWGLLDYFVEQPGRYTLTEAFFANHHALIHCLETKSGDQRGLAYDRDIVAFYGDPAYIAKLAEAEKSYDQTLTEKDGEYTFTITPRRGADSFKPVNVNGAQRGYRPIVAFLPQRVKNVALISSAELKPVITDDFLLIPNPRDCDPAKTYLVVFKAEAIR